MSLERIDARLGSAIRDLPLLLPELIPDRWRETVRAGRDARDDLASHEPRDTAHRGRGGAVSATSRCTVRPKW